MVHLICVYYEHYALTYGITIKLKDLIHVQFTEVYIMLACTLSNNKTLTVSQMMHTFMSCRSENLPGITMVWLHPCRRRTIGDILEIGDELTTPVSGLAVRFPFTLTSHLPPPSIKEIQALPVYLMWSKSTIKTTPKFLLCVPNLQVTRLEVSWWEAQTLFKEGNSQGTLTAEDDPQG